jgi:hypothetical protein
MTNDKDIVRYEVNQYGELPLSYGRYVRYEDYLEHMQELYKEIEHLQASDDWSDGWEEGYQAGLEEGR